MHTPGYYSPEACDLAEFEALISQATDPGTVPHASEVTCNVPVYDAAALPLASAEARRGVMAEWARVLLSGAGVLVLRGGGPDAATLDAATAVFERIIAAEKAAGGGGADHFAAGTNDRVWNALQKLCLADPALHARYFATPAIDAVCEAWLGPGYQMTAQINLVHPGGAAQQAHRDYHLGFQTAEVSALYPAHVHDLSPLMTLQGGIAHVDVPVNSGPTKLLPFSQAYRAGYAAWRRPDFRARFDDACIQLPLAKGDALFFNPALFHAAGENRTQDVHRMVNLLQVSSPFGRAMESVDRAALCKAVYPALLGSDLGPSARHAVISATAEGYSFPTNLDTDPPVGGLAPRTQAALMADCLDAGLDVADFSARLDAQEARRPA